MSYELIAMRRTGDLVKIEGGYQHRAIEKAFVVQRIWHELKIDLIERVMAPHSNDVILDIGCGSGVISNYLATKSKKVIGVDGNKDAVLYGKRTFAQNGLIFKHALIDEMDFADETFTKIYVLELIEHLHEDQIEGLFLKCHTILKPGAEMLVTTPNYRSLWPVIEKIMDLLSLAPKLSGAQHVTQLTKCSLMNITPHHLFTNICVGKFCGVAPFFGIFGKYVSYKINELEFKIGSPLGNVLFLTCSKR